MILATLAVILVLWLFSTNTGRFTSLKIVQGVFGLIALTATFWYVAVILIGGFWGKV